MDFEENNGKKKNCNTVWICSIINTCEYFFCHWDIYNSYHFYLRFYFNDSH